MNNTTTIYFIDYWRSVLKNRGRYPELKIDLECRYQIFRSESNLMSFLQLSEEEYVFLTLKFGAANIRLPENQFIVNDGIQQHGKVMNLVFGNLTDEKIIEISKLLIQMRN